MLKMVIQNEKNIFRMGKYEGENRNVSIFAF